MLFTIDEPGVWLSCSSLVTHLYGIELLNANQQLCSEDQGNLGVVNEAIGQRREIPLR